MTLQALAMVRGTGRMRASLTQRWSALALVTVLRTRPARVMEKEKGFRLTQVRVLGKQPVKKPGQWWWLALTWGMVRAMLPGTSLGCQPWRSCFVAAVRVK